MPVIPDGIVEPSALDSALQKVYDEGRGELTQQDNLRDHMATLQTALLRAAQVPATEIRLTFKTMARALVAWSWMLSAATSAGLFAAKKSGPFDVELINGSGIMFWTDEGRPELPEVADDAV